MNFKQVNKTVFLSIQHMYCKSNVLENDTMDSAFIWSEELWRSHGVLLFTLFDFHLPDQQVRVLGVFKYYRRTAIMSAHQNFFCDLVKMILELEHDYKLHLVRRTILQEQIPFSALFSPGETRAKKGLCSCSLPKNCQTWENNFLHNLGHTQPHPNANYSCLLTSKV